VSKIGVVISSFHPAICDRLKEGALEELHSAQMTDVEWMTVPGVVEIPLASQWLFQKGCSVVIALGAIIRGETSHYESCCRLVESGCMQVQLSQGCPIIFGVIAAHNRQQALARSGGHKGHIGRSSVQTALTMLRAKEQLNQS